MADRFLFSQVIFYHQPALDQITLCSRSRAPVILCLPFALSDFLTSKALWTNIWTAAMTEFWLISAPGEKTCQQTWDKLMVATTRTNNLSTNNKFNIPDLKVKQPSVFLSAGNSLTCGRSSWQVCTFCLEQVGTLDVLVGLSDELAKLDTFVER